MKIYNEIILNWNEDTQQFETVYEDSYNYEGDVDKLSPFVSINEDTTLRTDASWCSVHDCRITGVPSDYVEDVGFFNYTYFQNNTIPAGTTVR